MKITGVSSTLYQFPLARRMGDANSPMARARGSGCLIELHTDTGLTGIAPGGTRQPVNASPAASTSASATMKPSPSTAAWQSGASTPGKLKVGLDMKADLRRLGIVKEALSIAADRPRLLIDSNEYWSATRSKTDTSNFPTNRVWASPSTRMPLPDSRPTRPNPNAPAATPFPAAKGQAVSPCRQPGKRRPGWWIDPQSLAARPRDRRPASSTLTARR